MQLEEKETLLLSLCAEKTPNFEKIKRLLSENEDVELNLNDSKSLIVLSQNRSAYEQKDFIEIIRLFMHHRVGVTSRDNYGRNALHYLCRQYVKNDLPDIVRLLIIEQIDVNCKDNDGENAIFYLVQNAEIGMKTVIGKVYKILLRHGIGYCHGRCADKCFEILSELCNAEVIEVLRFWAEEEITLGWHLKCDDCKQILSIERKERREWQHHQLCNSVYSVFHLICKDLRNWASVQNATVTHFDVQDPAKWLTENPILKSAIQDSNFRDLLEISEQVKVAAEDSNFNCDMYAKFMRTLDHIAVEIGAEGTRDQIEWFHLLRFDEPNFHTDAEKDEEIRTAKIEWEKTLFDLAHKEGDNFFGKFLKKCAKERYFTSGIYSHQCHGQRE